MNRAAFEHVVAAAANITGEDEFVVVGSQAVLGIVPEPSEDLLLSMELDLYPRNAPEKAIEIDANLGDGSQFHGQYDYYAHGVGPETAVGPVGWQDRMVPVKIPPRVASDREPVAYCMEIHDLILAKCVAGRDRDWRYAREAVGTNLARIEVLQERADDLPINRDRIAKIKKMLENLDSLKV